MTIENQIKLLEWISENQPAPDHEYCDGWWRSTEFVQLLANDFEDFTFSVLSSFGMDTPPPTSKITMPIVLARSKDLEIIFKESWVLEPNYTVTVERERFWPIMLLDILQPIDPANKWLLIDFPSEYLHEPYREGASAFSGSVKNNHLLYALFYVLSVQVRALRVSWQE